MSKQNLFKYLLVIAVVCCSSVNLLADSLTDNFKPDITYEDLIKNQQFELSNVELTSIDGVDDCLYFNGENSFAIFDSIQMRSQMTISLWFRPEDVLLKNQIVLNVPSYLWVRTTVDREIKLTKPLTKFVDSENVQLTSKQWHHLVVTLQDDSCNVYIDRSRVITLGLDLKNENLYSQLKLGANPWKDFFLGYMRNVNYWNRSLSTDEIEALYHHELPQLPLRNGLVKYLGFENNIDDWLSKWSTWDNVRLSNDSIRRTVGFFNGKSSKIVFPDQPLDNQATMCAWVKPMSDSLQDGALLSCDDAFAFRVGSDDNMVLSVPWKKNYKTATGTIDPRQWNHVSVTFHAGRKIQVFINGKLRDTFTDIELGPDGHNLSVGNNLWNDYFLGDMDDLVVWNRVLTNKEIEEVYLLNSTDLRKALEITGMSFWGKVMLIICAILIASIWGVIRYYRYRLMKLKRDQDREVFLQKAHEIASKNIGDSTFSVAQFAEEMAFSKTKLYNYSKEHIGKSPIEYVRDLRIQRAGELLVDTELSVLEIMDMVGFESKPYFYKCFKHKYELTPVAYREKYKYSLLKKNR
ncbi:helix-turn-helix domain-containing protein [Puteibacter caeruleilacunae]|nr:helix-turn-helix domain-containing protein [Puteibacter caeruleilacunae]